MRLAVGSMEKCSLAGGGCLVLGKESQRVHTVGKKGGLSLSLTGAGLQGNV